MKPQELANEVKEKTGATHITVDYDVTRDTYHIDWYRGENVRCGIDLTSQFLDSMVDDNALVEMVMHHVRTQFDKLPPARERVVWVNKDTEE